MNEPLITGNGLKKQFGLHTAVDGVDLQVHGGEIYGLVGSDGAGKTTTLRMLVGALQMTAGEVSICGFDVRRQVDQARAQVGYLSQRFSLYEDLTVMENIRFFAEVRDLPSREWQPRCQEILEFVGLAEFTERMAGQLSGGMRQKLGLASALVSRPRVLLLDEPTTGVDPVTRQDFWQLIIRLVSQPVEAEAVCVLISTPYMDEAARCHRVGFMRRGKIIREGTPGMLRSELDGRILELRGSPLPLLRQVAAGTPGVAEARLFGDRLHLRLAAQNSPEMVQLLQAAVPAAGGELHEVRLVTPSLEDVFIALSVEAA